MANTRAPSDAPQADVGRIPALEATRTNADYWKHGAWNEPNREDALRCMEQAVNAWKNAAYAAHDALRAAPPSSEPVAEKLRELCDRLDWQGPSREANIRLTVAEARALLASTQPTSKEPK